MNPLAMQCHAACVSVSGSGILLTGVSGAGKSDLALRLIERGALLVADDRTDIALAGADLCASAPPALQGLLEIRGVGIVTLPFLAQAPLKLVVSLVPRSDVERLPERAFWSCHAVQLPLVSLHAFDTSACAKIHFALQHRAAGEGPLT